MKAWLIGRGIAEMMCYFAGHVIFSRVLLKRLRRSRPSLGPCGSGMLYVVYGSIVGGMISYFAMKAAAGVDFIETALWMLMLFFALGGLLTMQGSYCVC